MEFPRIAVIYDTSLRPDTTGGYCLRALQQMAEAEHFPPDRLGELTGGDRDLYLCVDDGLDYPFPQHLRPSAPSTALRTCFWAIDTHLNPSRALRRARPPRLLASGVCVPASTKSPLTRLTATSANSTARPSPPSPLDPDPQTLS